MKIQTKWPIPLLVVATLCFGARFTWQAANSAIGFKPHWRQWGEVAADSIGVRTTSLSESQPRTQARFWLDEVSRVASSDMDAQTAAGAAWMLDGPQLEFVKRHVRVKNGSLLLPNAPPMITRELDYDAIIDGLQNYEALCRDQCLARIDAAIRQNPDDVEFWRAKALLLFQPRIFGAAGGPRRQDWEPVLEQCQRHDPNNGLYDYLIAVQLWRSSAEYEWQEDGYILQIEDHDAFDRADARFRIGLAKPFVQFGASHYATTMAFLETSSIDRWDHLTAAASRHIDGRINELLFDILRWQNVRLDDQIRKGELDGAIESARAAVRVSDQVTKSGNPENSLRPKLLLRRWAFANLDKLSHLLTPSEASRASEQLALIQRDLSLIQQVNQRLAAKAGGKNSLQRTLTIIGMVAAQQFVLVTLALALLLWIVSRALGASGGEEQDGAEWLRPLAAWLAGGGVSFVVLGMCPAELVSAEVQTTTIRGSLWIGFALLAWGALRFVGKQFKLSRPSLAALTATLSMPILVGYFFWPLASLAFQAAVRLSPLVLAALFFALLLLSGWHLWMSCRLLFAYAADDVVAQRRKLLAGGSIMLLALVFTFAGDSMAKAMSVHLQSRVWVSPKVWTDAAAMHITADEIQNALTSKRSTWSWAFMQWNVHHGSLVAALMSTFILIIWRQTRRAEGGPDTTRRRWGQASGAAWRSCLVAALASLLVYFIAASPVADGMETYYQAHHRRLSDPRHARAEVEAAWALLQVEDMK